MARIAILSASLDARYDGVADYSRLLAEELVRQGHCVLRIGLMQTTDGWMDMAGTRFAKNKAAEPDYQKRLETARREIKAFDPDFASLQYVCFSFGRYGLPLRIGRDLRRIVGDRPLELMSHELWTGILPAKDMKTQVLSRLQQWNYRRFLRQLQPHCVHVSNPAYVQLLKRLGVHASVLPLFGNIPVTDLQDSELDSWEYHHDGRLFCKFLIFGSIHPEWPLEPLFSRILDFCDSKNLCPLVISAGGQGRGESLWHEMQSAYGMKFQFLKLGRTSGERISALINSSDFGLVTTPLSIIGKSGTAAAMLEHDLPLIVNRDEPCQHIGRIEPEEGYNRFMTLTDDFLNQMQANFSRPRCPASRLPDVTKRLMREMQCGFIKYEI
ncbi:MAG: hypothetical protein RJA81_1593 [Planctomycetota bacterium]|jgi:hypothetical protein